MIPAVATQGAVARETPRGLKEKLAHHVRRNHRDIKVDQFTVVGGVTLGQVDAVGIVAHVAGCFFPHDMFVVIFKTVVAEDAAARVALIAQGVI